MGQPIQMSRKRTLDSSLTVFGSVRFGLGLGLVWDWNWNWFRIGWMNGQNTPLLCCSEMKTMMLYYVIVSRDSFLSSQCFV